MAARSINVLVGTLSCPRKSPGFHIKNSNDGTSSAAQVHRPLESDKTKAGNTVSIGNGQRSVGPPLCQRPTYAGTNKPKPAAKFNSQLLMTCSPSETVLATTSSYHRVAAFSKIFRATLPLCIRSSARTPNGSVMFPDVTCPERKP
jgi:hypothetical protein